MENEGYQPTDKLDTSNPPNESKMVKVNSKVFITELQNATLDGSGSPIMVVEGLFNYKVHPDYQEYKKCAKCVWYNTRNELQSAFINLEILTEL